MVRLGLNVSYGQLRLPKVWQPSILISLSASPSYNHPISSSLPSVLYSWSSTGIHSQASKYRDVSLGCGLSCCTSILLEPHPHTMGTLGAYSNKGMQLWISPQLSTSIAPCLDSWKSCNWFADHSVLLFLSWGKTRIAQAINKTHTAQVLYRSWDRREHVHPCVWVDVVAAQEVHHHSPGMAFSQVIPLLSSHPHIQNMLFLE